MNKAPTSGGSSTNTGGQSHPDPGTTTGPVVPAPVPSTVPAAPVSATTSCPQSYQYLAAGVCTNCRPYTTASSDLLSCIEPNCGATLVVDDKGVCAACGPYKVPKTKESCGFPDC